MIRYAYVILSFLLILFGCAQDVPISRRDLAYAREDLELESRMYKSFAGSQEREAAERQILDHRTDYRSFFLFDGRMQSTSQETRFPVLPIDERARTKQINDLIDTQLHGSQESSQTK